MIEERYARHNLIPNWKQERLAGAKVAVVGCGALGNEVLKNLALLGIGNIWVIDYDTIEIHNLTRSVLFRETDIGKYKAEVITQRLRELNAEIQVHSVIGKLEMAFGRGLLREMDVVVGCLDSVRARRLLNKRCYSVGVPWIDGGISHYSGNVALFDPRVPETACYRCKMDTSTWERFNESYSCGLLKDNYNEPKLATTIMTASIVAAYQTEILVQLLLNNINVEPGSQLVLPVSHPIGFRTIEYSLDSECPDHYSIPNGQDLELPKFTLDYSPAQVAGELGLNKDWKLELPFDFISKFTCRSCGCVESVGIPKDQVKQSQTVCPECGERHREITEYCRISIDHEDAAQPLSFFKFCHREIAHYVCSDERIGFELTEDISVHNLEDIKS